MVPKSFELDSNHRSNRYHGRIIDRSPLYMWSPQAVGEQDFSDSCRNNMVNIRIISKSPGVMEKTVNFSGGPGILVVLVIVGLGVLCFVTVGA